MKKHFFSGFVVLVLAYAGACGYLYSQQRNLLYFPTPVSQNNLASLFELQSNGESLRVWKTGRESSDAVIYFGGNAEDVANNIVRFNSAFGDQAIYLVNYRGYGGSSGAPSEAGLFADALVIYDSLKEDHERISVIGRSLGSGVAAYLAAKREIERLVLVTPYDSIERVAQSVYPVFPVSLLLQDKFDSLRLVPNIKSPTLFILAEKDQIIPRKNSEALIAAFPPQQVKVRIIPGTEHNRIARTGEYSQLLSEFL